MTISDITKTRFKAFRASGVSFKYALKYARDLSHKLPRELSAPHICARNDETFAIYRPECMGFRPIGASDEICRSIDHNGWYSDVYQDDTLRGHVFRLAGRNGKQIIMVGFAEKNSDYYVMQSKPYEVIDGTDDNYAGAANCADDMAKYEAEKRLDFDKAWQLGSIAADCINENKDYRKELAEIKDEMRKLNLMHPNAPEQMPVVFRSLRADIARLKHEISLNNKKLARCKAGEHSEYSVYMDSGLKDAFYESLKAAI